MDGRPESGDSDLAWFDEIDLDPANQWLRMGTRQLGNRPWLIADSRRPTELALKARLLAELQGEVFAAEPGAEEASEETLALVTQEVERCRWSLPEGEGPMEEGRAEDSRHPLDRAGRLVQEDLCLMRPDRPGWPLAAASLCFPSRWSLAAKLGRPMAEVHQPVDGYAEALASRVDRFFDRLDQRIVWRRNWFIHPDESLFQPARPPGGDPLIPAERCLGELYLRSERQTLRRLPASGWVLFTIRIQQDPLGRFVADERRTVLLRRWLAEAPAEQQAHRGVSPDQRVQLSQALS